MFPAQLVFLIIVRWKALPGDGEEVVGVTIPPV
jgi:hypothetical protein